MQHNLTCLTVVDSMHWNQSSKRERERVNENQTTAAPRGQIEFPPLLSQMPDMRRWCRKCTRTVNVLMTTSGPSCTNQRYRAPTALNWTGSWSGVSETSPSRCSHVFPGIEPEPLLHKAVFTVPQCVCVQLYQQGISIWGTPSWNVGKWIRAMSPVS